MSVLISLLVLFLIGKGYLLVIYQPGESNFRALGRDEFDYTFIDTSSVLFTKKEEANPQFLDKRKTRSHKTISKELESPEEAGEIHSFFSFDPNTISLDSLKKLGFNQRVGNNLIRYRNAGGRINSPEGLLKIYGMDSLFYKKIKPYIQLEYPKSDKRTFASYSKSSKPNKKIFTPGPIDVNRADTSDFKRLKGIGTVYANRIIKFRNSLGGFYSIDQINEVWGISDSLYQSIQPHLQLDTSYFQKRNINEMDKDNLARHPYINWKEARIISKYKNKHGMLESIDDLYKIHGINAGLVDTLKQYFAVK